MGQTSNENADAGEDGGKSVASQFMSLAGNARFRLRGQAHEGQWGGAADSGGGLA